MPAPNMASRFLLFVCISIVVAGYEKHDSKRATELLKERRHVKESPYKRQPRTSHGYARETTEPPSVTEPPTPNPETTAEIRLVGGWKPSQGRVEILHNGEWGTVCDDWWQFVDARVVCRQLGYLGGIPKSGARFGEGSGIIWMDNVECIGNETQLSDCPHLGWGEHDCEHFEDAGVVCD